MPLSELGNNLQEKIKSYKETIIPEEYRTAQEVYKEEKARFSFLEPRQIFD